MQTKIYFDENEKENEIREIVIDEDVTIYEDPSITQEDLENLEEYKD